MEKIKDIKVVAFDADDTLWDCQSHFEKVIAGYRKLLSSWADERVVSEGLVATERKNMPILGYGTKAFTLSLIENAVDVTGARVTGDVIGEIVRMGRSLLEMPTTPLPGVEQTLSRLYAEGRYKLVVFTKGELLDQENKLRRSGLAKYFQHVEIVSDKNRQAFLNLCRTLRVGPSSLLMVGNSLRSDIAPALAIGSRAVHIPFHVTWELEHVEDFSHERMMKIEHFDQISELL